MKNIIEPLIERIQNLQLSDTFEIDEDESYQIEEFVIDDDMSISHYDVDVKSLNLGSYDV